MSFVLILTPTAGNAWPAVIGGYDTREAAEAAGREATMAHLSQEQFEEENHGFSDPLKWEPWRKRAWENYTVIPGAAAQ